MKEWEKELHIYRLTPAPPKENDLQKYISNYLAQKEDKYISWFLHYYERTLNEKAMSIVQDYAMYGHFLDIKQAYVIGMIKALHEYDPNRNVPFIVYKEYAASINRKELAAADPVVDIYNRRCSAIRTEKGRGTITETFAAMATELAKEYKFKALQNADYANGQYTLDMSREKLYTETDKRLR